MIVINGKKVAKKKVESATFSPPENAMRPKAKPKHVGGGWYELSNGEKIRGKEKAIEAMRVGD